MEQQPIELRKVRDFSEVINDSFLFLKENFKPLLQPLFIICGFFILMEVISSVFTYAKLSSIFTEPVGPRNSLTGVPLYTMGVIFDAFFTLLSQTFINLVAICYISVYVQKKNATPTVYEVWDYFKHYFFRVLGSGILMVLMLIVGFVLCVIPGIYLMAPFYLIIPIIVIENSSFSYAFNKCFRLVKENWWFTFGIIFVMGLIVSVSSSIANIPLAIIGAGSLFVTLKSFLLPLVVIFSVLKGVLMFLYIIPTIGICLCYFSLVEQKEGTGLMGRIDQIGKTDVNDPNLPAEEY